MKFFRGGSKEKKSKEPPAVPSGNSGNSGSNNSNNPSSPSVTSADPKQNPAQNSQQVFVVASAQLVQPGEAVPMSQPGHPHGGQHNGGGHNPNEWDHEGWLRSYRPLQEANTKAGGSDHAVRAQLKDLRRAVSKHNYHNLVSPQEKIPKTSRATWKFIAPKIPETQQKNAGNPEGSLVFSRSFTDQACHHYSAVERKRTCALNYANGIQIGGGYTNGAKAQEEDLCRQFPTYFTSLIRAKRDCYPFGPVAVHKASQAGQSLLTDQLLDEMYSDVLFTQNVECRRMHEEEGYRVLHQKDRWSCSFVAAAAPNVRAGEPFVDRSVFNAILNVIFAPKFADPNTKILILGAWGCGAFGCDPAKMIGLFSRAIKEQGALKLYEEIVFAIPEFPGSDNDKIWERGLREQFPNMKNKDCVKQQNRFVPVD